MRKDLEQLISEYLEEHPGARLLVEEDPAGRFTVSRLDLEDEAGRVHTHTATVAAGVRDLWGYRADGPGGMARKDGVQTGFASEEQMRRARGLE